MTSTELTRRSVLASAAGFAIGASVWSCAKPSGLADSEQQMLLQMARRLYPHDALQDDVYAECLTSIFRSAIEDPVLAETLRSGLDSLDIAVVGEWLAANPDVQVTALRAIESSAFFETMQDAVRTSLYVHPAVWKLIGYEGSSVEYGGYIDRGFDDIDWLPDD